MLPTTRLLQTTGLDLVEAMGSINDLLGSLNALRTSEGFVEILDTTIGWLVDPCTEQLLLVVQMTTIESTSSSRR